MDLGAEKGTIAAEKGKRKIAVEIKSFIGDSIMTDIEQALGQYLLYRAFLRRTQPDRELFLAVSNIVAEDTFDDIAGRALIEDYQLRIIVVSMENEEIVQWIN